MLQAYKTYLKRNCLELKEFVKRVRFKPRVPKYIEHLGYYEHLEDLNEKELLDLLAKLESDDNDIDITNIGLPDLDTQIDALDYPEVSDEYQKQDQNASQQVHAEIHTHTHYYLLVPENGTILQLPALAGQDINSVQDILNEMNPPPPPITPTRKPVSLATSTTIPFSTLTDRVPFLMADLTTSSCHCPNIPPTSELMPPHNKPSVPAYTNETQDITFTTLKPGSRPATSTVQQTTLPPVEEPAGNPRPNTTPTPVTYPPGFPAPVDTDGAFSCGGSSSGSTTNFVSPQYPNYISTTGDCDFYLVVDKDVCQVRVDFVDTDMLAPIQGACTDQELTIQGTVWPMGVQSFCGQNSGQHFYIEVKQGSRLSFVKFSVNTRQPLAYKWGLWLTQLKCNSESDLVAPSGCFQYYFNLQNVISSFNYKGGQYWAGQDYRICILAMPGKCAVKIESDGPFMVAKFGNYKTFPFTRSGVSSSYCVLDYILIPGGRGQDSSYSHDRFCGGELSSTHGARESETIYTKITSRVVSLEFHSGKTNEVYYADHHVGFRLVYTQVTEQCSGRQVTSRQEPRQGINNLPGKNLLTARTSLSNSGSISSSDSLLNNMMAYYLYPKETWRL